MSTLGGGIIVTCMSCGHQYDLTEEPRCCECPKCGFVDPTLFGTLWRLKVLIGLLLLEFAEMVSHPFRWLWRRWRR